MPREVKKRGRRAVEKQRKEAEESKEPVAKRQKITVDEAPREVEVIGELGDDYIGFGVPEIAEAVNNSEPQTTFYGLLTEEEQAYYANVNSKITVNDFENDEERTAFIEAVHRESTGKEIKLASSQSCSRHLERIIQLSTPTQLKSLFTAFLQDLDYLTQHRFGSHCCETLFAHSAQYVEDDSKQKQRQKKAVDQDNSFVSLYLQVAEKIKENVGFLLTQKFGSHCLRVLLLVLSGESLQDKGTQRTLASRRKEGVDLATEPLATLIEERRVPEKLKIAGRQLGESIVAGTDGTSFRALATSPTGNPVLQVLLRIELKAFKEDSAEPLTVFTKLVPDHDFDPESESSKFISSLVYDTTGAHLVQTLVKYMPGKFFKKMYRNLFKERIAKLARNEIASYVAVDVFERVGRDDLTDAAPGMTEEVPGLIERNRLAPLRAFIDRCNRRGVVHFPLRTAIVEAYGQDIEKWPASLLHKMLKLEIPESSLAAPLPSDLRNKLKVDVQGSLLAQTLLAVESFSGMIHDALLCDSPEILKFLSTNTIATRIIQMALLSETSSRKFLRTMMQKFETILVDLATDSVGSYVVDALWVATRGQQFVKERFAAILVQNEQQLRDCVPGRQVWRNWHLEIYKRRNREWVDMAKGRDTSGEIQPNADANVQPRKKSGIELARERAAAEKKAKIVSAPRTEKRTTRSSSAKI